MNATHFFEKLGGELFEGTGYERSLPPSSESFWTAVFALFLLHLASQKPAGTLNCWRPLKQGKRRYERTGTVLHLSGLTFHSMAVEPQTVMEILPEEHQKISLGGISPDVVLCLPGKSKGGNGRYALIENKITSGATLNPNQRSAYAEVVRRLGDASLFVLQPVGCSQNLFNATWSLHEALGEKFGILLWEEVFLLMRQTNFSALGIELAKLQDFMEDAKNDCRNWEVK